MCRGPGAFELPTARSVQSTRAQHRCCSRNNRQPPAISSATLEKQQQHLRACLSPDGLNSASRKSNAPETTTFSKVNSTATHVNNMPGQQDSGQCYAAQPCRLPPTDTNPDFRILNGHKHTYSSYTNNLFALRKCCHHHPNLPNPAFGCLLSCKLPL
jgi:hypothetical protein